MDLQDSQGDHHPTRALVLLPEGWPLLVVPRQCLMGTKHSCICAMWGRVTLCARTERVAAARTGLPWSKDTVNWGISGGIGRGAAPTEVQQLGGRWVLSCWGWREVQCFGLPLELLVSSSPRRAQSLEKHAVKASRVLRGSAWLGEVSSPSPGTLAHAVLQGVSSEKSM